MILQLPVKHDMDNNTPEDKSAHHARSALGGKKTAEVKFRTTDELDFAIAQRAMELRMSKSEWLEKLAALAIFGVDHVNEFDRQRNAKVAGLWPGAGHIGGTVI